MLDALRASRFGQARQVPRGEGGDACPRYPPWSRRARQRISPPRTWRLDPDGKACRRDPLDLALLPILVAAGCHWSEGAARDSGADPEPGRCSDGTRSG